MHFDGVLEKLEEFNLMPLVKFHQDYCEELVMQFFATVHFGTNEERTMTFMAGNEKRVVNFHVLVEICGYTFEDDSVHQGLHIHARGEIMNRNKMKILCGKDGQIGHVISMKPFNYNLHRFYRQTIAPKVVESNEVRGFMVNLMYATATHEGSIDVMDYIWK